MSKLAVTVAVTLALVLAPLSGAVTGASEATEGVPSMATTSEEPNYTVDVWEQSVLPFRANLSDAATTVENLNLRLTNRSDPDPPANRGELGVFDTGNVSFEYRNVFGANTSEYANDVSVIVAEPNENASVTDLWMPSSFGGDELAALNENATFRQVRNDTSIDENGEMDTTVEFNESGQYGVFLATKDDDDANGLTVDDDHNLSVEGNATIVGLESVLVHDGASEVEAPGSFDPGENVTFEANASVRSENDTHHAVVLYDEETFTEQSLTLNATSEFDENFSQKNVRIEHSIGNVSGVMALKDDVSVFGRLLSGRTVEGTISVADLVAFLTGEFGVEEPNRTVGENDTVLNASATAVADENASTEIEVGTFENWTDGDYRWLHVASTASGDEVATATGTIEAGGGGGPILLPPPSSSPGPGSSPVDVSDASLGDATIGVGGSVDVTATVTNAGDGAETFTAELVADGEVVDRRSVDVAAGETTTVTLTASFDETGTYAVSVNGASAGTLTVSDALPADFVVSDVSLTAAEVAVGESVDVTATVTNVGGLAGSYTVELIVDGELVDERTVELDGGEETTVSFTETFDGTGEYDLALGDEAVDTLVVDDSDDDGFFDGFGGFALAVALGALALVAVGAGVLYARGYLDGIDRP